MASGKHKAVLDGAVAVLAAMTTGGGYNFDYTATDQVGLRRAPELDGNEDVSIWVHAGRDEWQEDNISPRTFKVFFDVIVTAFVAFQDESDPLTETLELVRWDILKSMLGNTNLGGTCTDLVPAQSDEPGEDTNRKRAGLDLVFRATLTDISEADL